MHSRRRQAFIWVGLPIIFVSVLLWALQQPLAVNQGVDPSDVSVPGNNYFEDPQLENAVRAQLGLADEPLTSDHLASIKQLNIENLGIQSLSGIEQLIGLETLHAADNAIRSTEPLGQLPRLIHADVSFNDVSSFDDWLVERGPFDEYGYIDIARVEPGPAVNVRGGPLVLLEGNSLVSGSECSTEGKLEVCIYLFTPTHTSSPYDGGLFVFYDGELLLEEWVAWGVDFVTEERISDLTGNGKPNVVVRIWSMSGKSTLIIYEIDPTTRTVETLFANWVFGTFEDLDDDGVPEFIFHFVDLSLGDLEFPIVMRFNGSEYEPVLAPIPSDIELGRLAYSIRQLPFERREGTSAFSDIPEPLKQAMGNLITSGHWETAFELADASWPSESETWKAEALAGWFEFFESPWFMFGEYSPPPPPDFEAKWRAAHGFSEETPFR